MLILEGYLHKKSITQTCNDRQGDPPLSGPDRASVTRVANLHTFTVLNEKQNLYQKRKYLDYYKLYYLVTEIV